jgi:hypothetical protein
MKQLERILRKEENEKFEKINDVLMLSKVEHADALLKKKVET